MIEHLFIDGVFNSRKIRALTDQQKQKIFDAINIDTANIIEAVFWIFNQLKDYPKHCKNCGKPITKFISFNQGYIADFCSAKCSNSSSLVQKKKSQTSIRNYGTEFPMQSAVVKKKIKNATLENVWKSDRFSQFENYELLTEKENFKSVSKINWKCKTCKLEFSVWGNHGIISPECPSCFHHKTTSKEQRDLLNEIKHFYHGQIKVNDRIEIYPYELDLFFPEENIAIEFHGLYWHSYNKNETTEEKNKHLAKLEKCNNKNIKLIQIFENEWINKKEIILSRIKSALKQNKTIFARKCKVREISASESKCFQDLYHLQGHSIARIHLGLYLADTLVAVMTFGKPRFNKKYEWELIRYCSNNNIVGGASKLLRYFEKQFSPVSVISYADKRWSNGNLYNKLNFEKEKDSNPNYFYFKNVKSLESRLKYQKHKLKFILEIFNNDLTEAENMFNNGYRRIWDCGNLVFVKHYTKEKDSEESFSLDLHLNLTD